MSEAIFRPLRKLPFDPDPIETIQQLKPFESIQLLKQKPFGNSLG